MVIAKPFKFYIFYDILMTLYYNFISMSTFTFEVYRNITCGEAFYFSGIIQLICGASQVSDFYMVWVFNVKNNRADYRFFFVLTLINCHVM